MSEKVKNSQLDIEADLYRYFGLTKPSSSADHRAQQKLSFRNERNLYKRDCSATGKKIISIFSDEKPFPVYCQDYWWSDNWDALQHGRSFDFGRGFFPQFQELFVSVPQLAINNSQSENSEFTNQSQNNKNCYLIVASNFNEDCYHGMWFQNCISSVDCQYLEKSELCYEVTSGKFCYRCIFSENISSCSDCAFCRDCIGCTHCIGSVGLRNASYVFFNEQLTKSEYINRIQPLNLGNYTKLRNVELQFREHTKKFPHKFFTGHSIENSSGDYLQEVKNTFYSYNCRQCENVFHSRDAWRARNCIDLIETLENDYCLALEGCETNVDCAFSMKISKTHSSWYSAHCFSSRDLFGCVGLRSKQYCILNRQYTKSEYQILRGRIQEHMINTGEWGEYFPVSISPFGYNETVAHEYFPLSKSAALQNGFKWKDPPTLHLQTQANYVIPEDIIEVKDDVLDAILICVASQEPYRLTRKELEFYRAMNLPIPRIHPDVRHLNRMNRRNPRVLYERSCSQCGSGVHSTFQQEDPRMVFCDVCYSQWAGQIQPG